MQVEYILFFGKRERFSHKSAKTLSYRVIPLITYINYYVQDFGLFINKNRAMS